MNFALKSLVAAAAIASVGAVSAQTTTNVGSNLTLNGSTYKLLGGTGALSFSSGLITALNVGKVTIAGVEPATVSEGIENDPVFGPTRVSSTASAPIKSVTTTSTGAVTTVATAGGALMTAPAQAGVSLGGTLSVTNLAVDLTNKRIYASITGNFTGVGTANGYALPSNTTITTKDNFYLWNFANITGPTTLTGAGAYANNITGLSITADGQAHFISALRLYQLGASTLAGVSDYGSISSTINVAAVPEPSTYALMGLGLVAVAVAARRRAK